MRINEDFLDVEQLDDVVGNDVQVDAEQSYRFVMNIGLHNSHRLPELISSYRKIAQRLYKMGIENFYCDMKVYKFEFMTPTDVAMKPKEVESSDSGYIRVLFNQFTNLRHFIFFMYYMFNLVQVPAVGNIFRHWYLIDTKRDRDYMMRDIPQLFVMAIGDRIKYIHQHQAERFATQCGNNRAQLVDDPEGKLASRIHMFCENYPQLKCEWVCDDEVNASHY